MIIKATEINRAEILKYCSDEPSINLFIIGDIELYGFESEFQDVWMQTSDDNMSGIILRYHDNFILYSKTALEFYEIMDLMKDYKVNVISGKGTLINQLYPLVKKDFNKREMNFAELDTTEHLEDVSEIVLKAAENDAEDIARSYDHIDEFKHLYAGGFEGRLTQISNRIKSSEGVHMFIKEDNIIVSHGNTAAETSSCAMIGGVMTLPNYRGNGYAKKVVSALGHDLCNRGKKACLFYGTNEAKQLFGSLGFKDIDNWIVLGRKENE